MSLLEIENIKTWVKNLLQDEEYILPEFEKNEDAWKLVSKIISLNQEAEKDAIETIATEQHLTKFYKEKSEDINTSFEKEFSVKDLSGTTLKDVRKIASVANMLSLKDPTITNFLLCSFALDEEKEKKLEKELLESFTLLKINKKLSDVVQKNGDLQKEIERNKKIIAKQQGCESDLKGECKFLTAKKEEYAKRIRKSEKHFKKLEYNSSFSHSELCKRSEMLQNLEDKVNDLTSKLDRYQNLPPNEMLIRLKIKETQDELMTLQKEVESIIKEGN